MADAKAATVRATVVRGTYYKITEDGTRVPVLPGKGKDSEVDVTEAQLAMFSGSLVRTSEAAAEIQKVASESMAPATPTSEAINTPAADTPTRRQR